MARWAGRRPAHGEHPRWRYARSDDACDCDTYGGGRRAHRLRRPRRLGGAGSSHTQLERRSGGLGTRRVHGRRSERQVPTARHERAQGHSGHLGRPAPRLEGRADLRGGRALPPSAPPRARRGRASAHRFRRPLRAVHPAPRGAGRDLRGAPRRGWEPGRLRAGAWTPADRRGRAWGSERYGSCLERLAPPELADGYLPVLETQYADASGVHYRQESFASRVPETHSLVSFVRLYADATNSKDPLTRLRFTPSVTGLSSNGVRLARRGPRSSCSALEARSPARRSSTRSRVALPHRVRRLAGHAFVEPRPDDGRDDLRRCPRCDDRLLGAPPRRGHDRRCPGAARARRRARAPRPGPAAHLALQHRQPVRAVLVPRGRRRRAGARRAGVRGRRARDPAHVADDGRTRRTRTGRWARSCSARRRTSASSATAPTSRGATPVLRGYVATLGRQIDASPTGLLDRERYSSDIHDAVYGLHSQAVVWAGLRGMADAWGRPGSRALAARCRALAARLETGLRRAVRGVAAPAAGRLALRPGAPARATRRRTARSSRRAPGATGTSSCRTRSRRASSPPTAAGAGVWRYMQRHGSRLLGLVRAGAYALYGRDAPFPVSGTDQVYGINVARFLADNGEADQLVLSLYGQLAAAMTPGTFVAGEAASVAPLPGRARARRCTCRRTAPRNAAFLETLRLLLVHETRRDGPAARARLRDPARLARRRAGGSPCGTRRRASARLVHDRADRRLRPRRPRRARWRASPDAATAAPPSRRRADLRRDHGRRPAPAVRFADGDDRAPARRRTARARGRSRRSDTPVALSSPERSVRRGRIVPVLGRSSVAVIGPRVSGALRHAVAIGVCALTAHAVAFGSLVPQDGAPVLRLGTRPSSGFSPRSTLVAACLPSRSRSSSGLTSRACVVVLGQSFRRLDQPLILEGLFTLARPLSSSSRCRSRSSARSRRTGSELASFAPQTFALLVGLLMLAARDRRPCRLIGARGHRSGRPRTTGTRRHSGATPGARVLEFPARAARRSRGPRAPPSSPRTTCARA